MLFRSINKGSHRRAILLIINKSLASTIKPVNMVKYAVNLNRNIAFLSLIFTTKYIKAKQQIIVKIVPKILPKEYSTKYTNPVVKKLSRGGSYIT